MFHVVTCRDLDHPANKRNSAGAYLYSSEQLSSASAGNATGSSSCEDGETVVTLDPPPTAHAKMNKMAKLKKTVAERRPQREEELDSEVLSSMATLDPTTPPQGQLSNGNSNNSNNRLVEGRSEIFRGQGMKCSGGKE